MAGTPKRTTEPDWLKPAIALDQTWQSLERGIVAVDMELRLAWCNAKFAGMSGLAAEELRGRRLTEVMAGGQFAEVQSAVQQALAGTACQKPQSSLDFPAASTTGWFAVEASPLGDAAGAAKGALLVLHSLPPSTDTSLILREEAEAPTPPTPPDFLMANAAALAGNLLALVDAARETLLLLDRQGRVVFANRTATARMGLPLAAMIGRSMTDFLPPAVAKVRFDWGEKALAGNTTVLFEDQRGSYWLENRITPVPGPDGQPLLLACFSRDVTEQRRAVQALRESEARYRLLFEAMPVGVGISTLSGRMLAINPAMREISGYTLEEFQSADMASFYAPPEQRQSVLARLRAEGKVREFEVALRRKDGPFPALVNMDLVELQGDQVLLTTVRDLTSQKQSEQALRESEAKYRRLYDSMTDAQVSTDMAGCFQEANAAYLQMVGYSLPELRQLTYQDITPAKWHQFETGEIVSLLLTTGECPVYEKEYRHKDGRLFPVELRTFLIRDAAGQPIGMWAIVRDITERRLAQDKLRQSEELFSKAFNLSPVMMAISSIETGRIINANELLLRTLELPRERVIGKTSLELGIYRHPQGREILVDRVRREGAVHNLEITLQSPRGLLECLVSTAVIQLEGQPHLLTLALDITLRKQAEQALRESEARMRAVLEGADEAIVLLSATGRVLIANPTAAERLGLTIAECEQRTLMDCLPSPLANRARQVIRRVRDCRTAVTEEGQLGGLFYETSFYPVKNPQGEVGQIAVFARDVTTRKRMELELAQSRNQLQALLDSAPVVFWALDHEGIFTLSEGSMLASLGLKPRQVVGLSVFQVYRNDPELCASLRLALKGEIVVSRNKVGGRFFDSRINPLRGPEGEILGVIGVSVDVTEQVKAERNNLRRMEFERTLQAVSTRFVGRVDLGRSIHESLADLGEFSLVGRAYLFEITAGGAFMDNTHEWCAPGVEPQIHNMQRVPAASVPWWMEQLHRNAIINVSSVADLPDAAALERELLLAQGVKSVLALPVWVQGRLWGFIGFDDVTETGRWTFEDENLLRFFSDVLTNAMERHQAEELLRESRGQLRALALRNEAVREEERSQIAREIHDDLGQTLTSLKMDLAWLNRNLGREPEALRVRLSEMSQLIDNTIHTVRRISSELRPGVLDDLGLAAAIEWQAQEFQRRTGIPCDCQCGRGAEVLEPRQATALFRILQEALTNIMRHAQATQISIRLHCRRGQAVLEVSDNGRGISREESKQSNSLGLLGMRERALAHGGQVTIAGQPGQGTTISARIPLGAADREPPARRRGRQKKPPAA